MVIIKRKSLFLCALLLLCATARAEITEQQIEADCAKIPVLASQGEQLYKTQKYAKARDAFEQQAAWSESCALDDSAIATAYNNVALTWIREGEWRKARAWLMLRPNDSKSIYNLKLIKDKQSALPPPVFAAGEYWRYAGRASWNVLSVKALPTPSRYQVNFQGYWFGLMGIYFGPNIGELSATVTLENDKTIVALREGDDIHCDISLAFSSETIDASTDTFVDCGFGANVRADGHYLRVE